MGHEVFGKEYTDPKCSFPYDNLSALQNAYQIKASLYITYLYEPHADTHPYVYISVYYSPFHRFQLHTPKWSTLEVTGRALQWNGRGERKELNMYVPPTLSI